MNLYRWESEFLQRYANGYIIVQAETVEQAREKVLAGLDEMMEAYGGWSMVMDEHKGRYGYEQDSTDYNRLRKTLLADLAEEPEHVTRVLWLWGSE